MIIIKNTTLKVVAVLILATIVSCNSGKNKDGKKMVWNDEFDYSWLPDSTKLAVGGTWGGAHGIDTTIFPQVMKVDWVRVYKEKKVR